MGTGKVLVETGCNSNVCTNAGETDFQPISVMYL